MATLKDKCAIVGVGETQYSRSSGVSTLALAADCSLKAIEDAGLTVKDIDGIIAFKKEEHGTVGYSELILFPKFIINVV